MFTKFHIYTFFFPSLFIYAYYLFVRRLNILAVIRQGEETKTVTTANQNGKIIEQLNNSQQNIRQTLLKYIYDGKLLDPLFFHLFFVNLYQMFSHAHFDIY